MNYFLCAAQLLFLMIQIFKCKSITPASLFKLHFLNTYKKLVSYKASLPGMCQFTFGTNKQNLIFIPVMGLTPLENNTYFYGKVEGHSIWTGGLNFFDIICNQFSYNVRGNAQIFVILAVKCQCPRMCGVWWDSRRRCCEVKRPCNSSLQLTRRELSLTSQECMLRREDKNRVKGN